MASRLAHLACVCLLSTSACLRRAETTQKQTSVSTADSSERNPLLRTYANAVIVYELNDHSRRTTWSVKGSRARRVDEGGPFDASGDYSVRTPVYDYNVLAGRQQVVELTSDTQLLFVLYKKLDSKAKAAVDKSLALIGPDVPFYSEHEVTFLHRENILGLDAGCYRFYQSLLDDTSERCYWRGLEVSHTGKSPMSGEDISGRVTSVDPKISIDDSVFTWPRDFRVDSHNPEMDAAMTDLYAQLFERMQRPDFTLAQLSRYAR